MEKLGDEIWTVTQPLKLGGADFGTRMTVVRLGEELLLHSPVRIDDALAERLSGLGRVRWIAAPNTFHHLFAGRAKERWPGAEVLAAPGVEKKQKALPIDGALPDAAPEAWRGALETLFVGGMPALNEVVFFHRPSKTLVLTDFLFNFGDEGGWWTRTVLSMAGARGGAKQSRLLRFVMKDKEAVKQCRDEMLGWDFARATVCHGDVIEGDAKDVVAKSTAWLG